MGRYLEIAVLILTYRRLELLEKCLKSLKNQLPHEFDLNLYISVNGPDLKTKEYLDSVSANFKINMLYNENEIPVGEARNKLINKISEKWICFLDDDIYLPNNYFKRAHKFIHQYSNVSVFGGPDQNTEKSSVFQDTLSLVMESYFATGPTNKRHKSYGNEIIDGNEVNLILCNFWAKKSVFDIKKFPVEFRRNEENYLLSILKDNGIVMKYYPNLIVHHNRKEGYRKLIRVLYLAGLYRAVSIVYYPRSAHIIFFFHLLFILLLLSTFLLNINFFFGLLGIYLFIVLVESARITLETRSLKSLIISLKLFGIFNFIYPFGQIHGYIKSVYYKIRGFKF